MRHDTKSLSDISSKDIKDKSKHDGITKFVALSQVLWFSAECITRLAQGLPVSLLELNTFVHTLYALITYALWWKKPFDVDRPTVIKNIPDDVFTSDRTADGKQFYLRKGVSTPFVVRLNLWHLLRGDDPFEVDPSHPSNSSVINTMAASFFGALYGALHVAAWNSPFPTPLEGLLWRVSAVCIIVCGMNVSLSQLVITLRDGKNKGIIETIRCFVVSYSIIISCVARLFIVTESFRSLVFLPAAAYQLPDWSRYIPHFN